MSAKLRVVVADDERPARSFLVALLRTFDDVEVVAEASDGAAAVASIERERPDLALLDLQMPEVDGLGVVRRLPKDRMPLVAFVTAYDDFAVDAFDVNAIDYLLKPVDAARLRETLNRAHERLERLDSRDEPASQARDGAGAMNASPATGYLERIPVRHRGAIVLVPVEQIASIVADGELLVLTTATKERFVLAHRLKDLEVRLDPKRFVRLSRGSLVNIAMIRSVSPMPGGTYVVTLANGQQLGVSRLQSRLLRDQLLKI